jgi:hypothetical protein
MLGWIGVSALPASVLNEEEEDDDEDGFSENRDDERSGTKYNVSIFSTSSGVADRDSLFSIPGFMLFSSWAPCT